MAFTTFFLSVRANQATSRHADSSGRSANLAIKYPATVSVDCTTVTIILDLRFSFASAGRGRKDMEHICEITGNRCGTDTWAIDRPCKCDSCAKWLATIKMTTAGEDYLEDAKMFNLWSYD